MLRKTLLAAPLLAFALAGMGGATALAATAPESPSAPGSTPASPASGTTPPLHPQKMCVLVLVSTSSESDYSLPQGAEFTDCEVVHVNPDNITESMNLEDFTADIFFEPSTTPLTSALSALTSNRVPSGDADAGTQGLASPTQGDHLS